MEELTTVAADLYGLPPGEFTAARNDRAKQLKAAGGTELAAAVKALPKPSAAAWVVNTMVRHMSGPIAELLEVGATLRQAQEDLDAARLRQLNKDRRALVAAVVRDGRALAAEHGQQVSAAVAAQVESTLNAAMTDAGAESALRTGLLVDAMAATGLGPADLDGVVAVPEAMGEHAPSAPRKKAKKTKETKKKGSAKNAEKRSDEEERKAREAAAAKAREELDAAETRATRASDALGEAEAAVQELEANELRLRSELDELRRQMHEHEHELDRNERALTKAEKQQAAARRQAEDASARADVARAELDRLEEPHKR